jgi:hypothetical protein
VSSTTADSSAYVNLLLGDHGSIINPAASGPATVEMQTESVVFASSFGTTVAITVPGVVQP